MMTSHLPRDVPGADADRGTTVPAAGLRPGRHLIAVMLLTAAALDLSRCGIVMATARHAGPAIGLVSAGLAAAWGWQLGTGWSIAVLTVLPTLAGAAGGAWVVVNATEYSDLETVARSVLEAEHEGQSFLFRTGPSFVRALSGLGPRPPLRGAGIWGEARRGGHGLVVVGSHVGQTSRQVAALRARRATADMELDVQAVLGGGPDVAAAVALRVAGALAHSDVLLYTSRDVVAGRDAADSLTIARTVSAALSRIIRGALAARPAWVVAKGGITSHDVMLHGLGIRRAEVAGQLFPGTISVFRPLDAAPGAVGMPYVVFAGNVGDDGTLAQVVAILNGEREVS